MSFMETGDSPAAAPHPAAGGGGVPGSAAWEPAGLPPGPPGRTDSPRWRMLPVQERDKHIPVVNRVSSGIHIPVTHYPAHAHQPAGTYQRMSLALLRPIHTAHVSSAARHSAEN